MSTNEPKPFELPQAPGSAPIVDSAPANDHGVADFGKPPINQAPTSDEISSEDVRRLGAHLADAMQDGGYHPVVLFGTSASGKTSLLLSLFATLASEPRLETGLALCDPILGTTSGIGRKLHQAAQHTFEVKTQAFIEGEKIPRTNVTLPFFIPVELRPAGKPTARLAFLESNGEWYRPLREDGHPLTASDALFPKLRSELEDFIASFQGSITFIYLTPYTQLEGFDNSDSAADASQLRDASLAIKGVLEAYDRTRINHRADDRHLMLVTKWDAHSARDVDRAEGLMEDRDALNEFCAKRYSLAIAKFQSMNLRPDQRQLNAYCSGIINQRGLLQLQPDGDVHSVVSSYPIRLWTWLYHNALKAADMEPMSLFPEPPPRPAFIKVIRRVLDAITGG